MAPGRRVRVRGGRGAVRHSPRHTGGHTGGHRERNQQWQEDRWARAPVLKQYKPPLTTSTPSPTAPPPPSPSPSPSTTSPTPAAPSGYKGADLDWAPMAHPEFQSVPQPSSDHLAPSTLPPAISKEVIRGTPVIYDEVNYNTNYQQSLIGEVTPSKIESNIVNLSTDKDADGGFPNVINNTILIIFRCRPDESVQLVPPIKTQSWSFSIQSHSSW